MDFELGLSFKMKELERDIENERKVLPRTNPDTGTAVQESHRFLASTRTGNGRDRF